MTKEQSPQRSGSWGPFSILQFLATMIASSYLKQTIITVLCVLGIPSYLSAPKPISVHLGGRSSITIPANRAIVSLRVYAEGPEQYKVADEVRQTAEDILGTMRPLTQITLAPSHPKNESSPDTYEPSIVNLSVTTFRTYSWLKPGTSLINRDAQQYQSSMEIEAEYRDFDALGLLLAQISKQSSVTVQSLKWTIDATTKKSLFSKCRTEAMVDALDKVRAYVRPLGMDKVRAIKLNEYNVHSRDLIMADVAGFGYHGSQVDVDYFMHDELDSGYAESRKAQPAESFGLEPKSMEIVAEIEGEFCAWKTGIEAFFRRGGV